MTDQEAVEAPRKARVFVSYSRKDTAFVDRVAAALAARGYEVLLDREDISGGEAWKERLDQLILQADAVAFVLSPDSVASPECDWETQRTVELGKRLIPLCFRQVEQAPEQLARLNYIFIDTDAKFDDALTRLSNACDVDINWVREHTRLTDLAARWDVSKRRGDALLRGEGLSAAEHWLAARPHAGPAVPETLTAYLQASRAEEAAGLERERKRLRRMRGLQLGVGGLVALAAVIVVVAGIGVTRLISGIGARNSVTLAELARQASDQGNYERAARYARAGLAGADFLLVGFDATHAEAELRRALAGPLRMRFASEGPVSAAYSADGTRVVIWGERNGVRVAEVATGREQLRLEGHEAQVNFAAFSPDGTRIVTTSDDDTARVWDAASGRELHVLRGHEDDVWRGAFSPDGGRFVTVGPDDTARVWDLESGQTVSVMRGHERELQNAMFTPDGTRVVTGSSDETARVWDAASGRQLAIMRGHTSGLQVFGFLNDGARVLTASWDETARIWNVADGSEVHVLRASGLIGEAAISPDGATIATAANNGQIQFWDVASGAQVRMIQAPASDTYSLSYSADGARLLTASSGGVARVWDIEAARLTLAIPAHGTEVWRATLSPDGRSILSTGEAARIWALDERAPSRVLRGASDQLGVVSVSRDGKILARGAGTPAFLWAPDADQPITLAGENGHVFDAVFSADGTRVVTSSQAVRVWDAATGRQLNEVQWRSENTGGAELSRDGAMLFITEAEHVRVLDLATGQDRSRLAQAQAFTPFISLDGSRVATGSMGESVRVWDAETGQEVAALGGHVGGGFGRLSRDGRYAITIGLETGVRLWLVDEARVMRSLNEPGESIDHSEFSPDGARYLVGSHDVARLFETESGREIAALRGHEYWINDMTFSEDGQWIVTASEGFVRLWHAASGRLMMRWEGHEDWAQAAAFSPDATWVATASRDMTVRVWPMPTSMHASRRELLDASCAGPLANGGGRFTDVELSAAPVIDPALDGDACAPASLWRRMRMYLRI